VTYFATPDYLCVGSDEDYVRVPLNPVTATKVAMAFNGFLPTRRIVNAIFRSATRKLVSQTMPYGEQMRSTQWLLEHNAKIQKQLEGPPGELVAGHKKDVVLCRALWLDKNGRPWGADHHPCVAIYGWAQTIVNGVWTVWQGLNSSSHDNEYEDYSHGIRVLADAVYINNELYSFGELLVDSAYASFLSDEGTLPAARYPNT
jgi:hypothetical protein